jgi:hypothetical protein
MKTIGSFIATLLFSVVALSAQYSGSGTWKSLSGESGEYSVVANIEPGSDESVLINQTISWGEQTLSLGVILQKIDDNFYNVLCAATNNKIGSGYCWPLDNGDKLCHSVTKWAQYVSESTIKKTADAIYRMGSKTNKETGEKVIWKDKLLPSNPPSPPSA